MTVEGLLEPSKRVSNRQINLSRIRRQNGRGQQAAAIAFPRLVEQAFEFGEIIIRRVMEARVFAIKRGDAVDGVVVNRPRQPPRGP